MKFTEIDYERIRKAAEQEQITLTDREFLHVVYICTRKIELNGLDAEYMNILLPDEIRHYAIRREVNIITLAVREMEEMENGRGTDNKKAIPCGS